MLVTWDARKAAVNLRKHGVNFREASTALRDPLATTFPDYDRSANEDRFLTLGTSVNGRLLVVSHTEESDTIRIISARRATRHEREFYEEGQSNSE